MKKSLVFLLLALNAAFALYSFNITVRQTGNLSVSDSYPNSAPNMMFYNGSALFIADPGVPGIFTYADGELSRVVGAAPAPLSVFVQGSTVYVADDINGLKKLGPKASIYDKIHPHGLSIYNDSFYLTDFDRERIDVVDKDGHLLDFFGSHGTYAGQFIAPEDLQIFNNTIYVANSGNSRVDSFALNSSPIISYGKGQGGVNLVNPTGMFVDGNYVYVADPDGDKVVVYTMDGYPVSVLTQENLTNPRDVVVANGNIYISEGYNGLIWNGTISVKPPSVYVEAARDALAPAYSAYSDNSKVAAAIGVPYNQTIVSSWNNAEFALSSGRYGEAFYGIMGLNSSVDIGQAASTLEPKLGSSLTALARNSSAKAGMDSLIAGKDYSGAYALYLSALGNSSGNNNNTNNTTPPPVNVTKLNTSGLEARAVEIKALVYRYKLDVDTNAIEAQIAAAKTSQAAFDNASSLLDSADQKIAAYTAALASATVDIYKLKSVINAGGLFVDYSKAKARLNESESLLASDPAKADAAALAGFDEVKKAQQSASILTIILIAGGILLVLAAVAGVAFFLIRGRGKPPEYHFKG